MTATALALTGCGPMDTGGAEARYITEHFGGNPLVAEVDVNGQTKLPFAAGNVSGMIVTEPDVSDEDIRGLVREIREYQADTRTGSNADNLRISVDGVVTGIVRDEEGMDDRLDSLFALRADADVLAATLDVSEILDRVAVEITAVDADVVQDVTRRWAEAPQRLADVASDYLLTVETEDGDYLVDGPGGPWWDAGFRAWDAVAETHTVTSVQLEPGILQLRVADDGEIDAARELAQEVVGPDTRVTVSGGILTITDGADGTDVRTVMNALTGSVGHLLTGAATNDEELAIGVVDVPAMRAVAEELALIPEAGQFIALRIGTPDYEVAAAPDSLLEWIGHFEETRANTGATRIFLDSVRPRQPAVVQRFEIRFDPETPATDDEVTYLARTWRPLVGEATSVSVSFGTGRYATDSAMTTTADPLIDEDDYIVSQQMERSPQLNLFVRTWNGAN